MRIKDIDLKFITRSKFALDLLHSLSRGSKIVKQIICEEPKMTQFIKSSFDEKNLKIIANLSIENKVFVKDCLP